MASRFIAVKLNDRDNSSHSVNNFSGRLLTAFLALEETRHFTLAAQRCHVSQSAFSQMIARLEREAGARLFDRDTRNVALTPEGELFAASARRLAAEIEGAFANLRDHAARRKGKVAIAALPSLSAQWLPSILAEYRRRHPGIELQLHDGIADRNLDLVRSGAVDFALTAGGDLDEFETRLLFHEPFYLACRRDHPLAKRSRIAVKDLAGVDFVHSIRTGSVWKQVQPALRGVGVRDTGIEVEHLSTLAGLVAHGVGVTLVPELALFQFERLELASVRVSDKSLRRPLYFVKRRGRSLSVAAATLLELVEASRARRKVR
jgi:DNA-binding transcriptional LysR family regulator